MSKKPNLLRDALKNMRVNAPSFKAPIETQKEAPRKEVPLTEAAPKGPPQTVVAKRGNSECGAQFRGAAKGATST